MTTNTIRNDSRDPSRAAFLLKELLGANAVFDAVGLVCLFLLGPAFRSGQFSEAWEETLYGVYTPVFTWVRPLLYLITAVVFAVWIYRAQRNVRAMGAKGMSVSPGMAVGYFFVPVLLLYKPFVAMDELWRASHGPTCWRSVRPGAAPQLWWGLWLGSTVLEYLSLVAPGESEASRTLGVQFGLAAFVCSVALSLAAMAVVAQITAAQVRVAVESPAPTLPPPDEPGPRVQAGNREGITRSPDEYSGHLPPS